MSIKKLCSIGLLNIKFNLILRKSVAENYNFNIDDYNSIDDIEKIFCKTDNSKENENIDYINYISLSSDDNLLNTLFFINRAYKLKTFIEYLIPNEIKFKKRNYFLKNIINEILSRNYFFIVENNIINKISKLKFIIIIINDDNDTIISKKEFNLFEEIENYDKDIFDNEYFDSNKLNYNFNKNDYLLIDLDSIKSLNWKSNNDLILFINNIKNNNNLKIILSINKNALFNNNPHNNKIVFDILKTNKSIIDSSDIIFCFKNSINTFLREYSIKNRIKPINDSIKSRVYSPKYLTHSKFINTYSDFNVKKINQDLNPYDINKNRYNNQKLTIVLDDFDYLTIYNQEFEESELNEIIEPYIENFCFSLLNKNHTDKEFKENQKILDNNFDKSFHIFIGGFLSRFINNIDSNGNVKSYEECFIAGNLTLKNYLFFLKNNIDYITDIDEYNVIVPKIKKGLKERLYKEKKEELRKIRQKEQKFILDCINPSKSQKKEYNSLFDFNCTSFLSKKNIMNHLMKYNFINKNNKNNINKKNYYIPKTNTNSIKTYFHKNKNLKQNFINYKPLSNNKSKRYIENDNKKIMFKKIFDKNKKENGLNNHKNYSKDYSDFIYKTYNNSNDRELNMKNKNRKLNIKIPSLNLRKKTYDFKKEKNLTNRKEIENFDSSLNNCETKYIEYLYKLYQPKNKFQNFLYNLSNIKIKK